MKNDATIRARVPKHIANLIGDECLSTGVGLSTYLRQAVLEKVAKDRKTTIKAIIKGA